MRAANRGQGPGDGPDDGTGRQPRLSVALLTREYPPEVYGGAGVHVEYLARELASVSPGVRALFTPAIAA